ncbi:SDR family oxidoreductase [Allobacillus sp. GCM10007489]|uniref:SDR family oxidoreductase n=1 Tax=unclassified Allobacillus TaxID=2628859 RepID=UPI0021044E7E|nr:SDR family oxidoreductase [Allobacillus sp. SKP2-8]
MSGMEKQNGKITPPAQKQSRQPGFENEMNPEPEYIREGYKGSDKLKDKVAIVTGGDSGIGRAVSLHFAIEGAKVVVVYYDEDEDANKTKELIEKEGGECLLIAGDIGKEDFSKQIVDETLNQFGKIDILVNNAAEQHVLKDFMDITSDQLKRTFETNFFGMVDLTQAVMPHLKEGSSIINTSSITAYEGNPVLIDYSATKGAITSFTRSLSQNVVGKGIRVNGVAPGPIWTPLIPASFSEKQVDNFGGSQPMKRPGQPAELAPAYVYLASDDSTYVSGQMIHVNGGAILNG